MRVNYCTALSHSCRWVLSDHSWFITWKKKNDQKFTSHKIWIGGQIRMGMYVVESKIKASFVISTRWFLYLFFLNKFFSNRFLLAVNNWLRNTEAQSKNQAKRLQQWRHTDCIKAWPRTKKITLLPGTNKNKNTYLQEIFLLSFGSSQTIKKLNRLSSNITHWRIFNVETGDEKRN